MANAQNSGEITLRPIGKPFPKGVSGNPGGRPKGLVRRIREETDDGGELVEYMLTVFRDESESTKTRVEAATWLADRGFGRPVQSLEQKIESAPAQGLTAAELAEIIPQEILEQHRHRARRPM